MKINYIEFYLFLHILKRIEQSQKAVYVCIITCDLIVFFVYFQGRCNREKPPCKYFHPAQHLRDQLLLNGRNHLALKNALMQQMVIAPGQQVMTGQVQAVVSFN